MRTSKKSLSPLPEPHSSQPWPYLESLRIHLTMFFILFNNGPPWNAPDCWSPFISCALLHIEICMSLTLSPCPTLRNSGNTFHVPSADHMARHHWNPRPPPLLWKHFSLARSINICIFPEDTASPTTLSLTYEWFLISHNPHTLAKSVLGPPCVFQGIFSLSFLKTLNFECHAFRLYHHYVATFWPPGSMFPYFLKNKWLTVTNFKILMTSTSTWMVLPTLWPQFLEVLISNKLVLHPSLLLTQSSKYRPLPTPATPPTFQFQIQSPRLLTTTSTFPADSH